MLTKLHISELQILFLAAELYLYCYNEYCCCTYNSTLYYIILFYRYCSIVATGRSPSEAKTCSALFSTQQRFFTPFPHVARTCFRILRRDSRSRPGINKPTATLAGARYIEVFSLPKSSHIWPFSFAEGSVARPLALGAAGGLQPVLLRLEGEDRWHPHDALGR